MKTIYTAKNLKKLISIGIKSKSPVPLMIWGNPGIGKSSILNSLPEKCFTINFATLSSKEDMFGITEGETEKGNKTQVFYPMKVYVDLVESANNNPDKNFILFMDEVNRNELTLSAAMGVITDRELGDLKIPENVTIVSAANIEGDIINLDTASKTRYKEVMFNPTVEDWYESVKDTLKSDKFSNSFEKFSKMQGISPLFYKSEDNEYTSGRQLISLDRELSIIDNFTDAVFVLSTFYDYYDDKLKDLLIDEFKDESDDKYIYKIIKNFINKNISIETLRGNLEEYFENGGSREKAEAMAEIMGNKEDYINITSSLRNLIVEGVQDEIQNQSDF